MRLRPPTPADHSALVAFFAEVQRAYGTGGMNEGEVRDRLAGRLGDLDRDYRLAVDGDAIVGWANIWDPANAHERLFIDVRTHPRERSTVGALLDWVERRTDEVAAGAPARLLANPAGNDSVQAAELRRRGFDVIRHFFRMEVDHVEEPAEPVWPKGIRVRTFRTGDARAVYEATQEAFLDHWDPFEISFEEWLPWGPGASDFDPGLWFLAEDDGEIAGAALCKPAREPGAGVVAVLAVRRPWRRRGLGRALLLQAFGEFRRRGYRKTELGVDAENLTGAVRLYEQVGMKVVKRSDIFEKRVGDV
jgi:mycothiol synthase